MRVTLLLALSASVHAEDASSLLQSKKGKQLRTSAGTSEWIEEFVKSPQFISQKISRLHPSEQRDLLQQFASSNPTELAKEFEHHREALAMALRRSPLASYAKTNPDGWVSALQHHAHRVELAIASEDMEQTTDGKETTVEDSVQQKHTDEGMDSTITAKGHNYTYVGQYCKTGLTEILTADEVCEALCSGNDCNYEITWEDIHQDVWGQAEEQFKKCKRSHRMTKANAGFLTVSMLSTCQDACVAQHESLPCTGIQYNSDTGECSLFDTEISFADEFGGDASTSCWSMDHEVHEGEVEGQETTHTHWQNLGQACATDLGSSELNMTEACQALCDQDPVCGSVEVDTIHTYRRKSTGLQTVGGCVRHPVENEQSAYMFKEVEGPSARLRTSLQSCAAQCSKMESCAGFEYEDSCNAGPCHCHLYGSALNVTLSAVDTDEVGFECYLKAQE